MEGSANALETLGTAITEIVGYMGDVVTYMLTQPILLIPVAIFVVGACIGLAGRLIGR